MDAPRRRIRCRRHHSPLPLEEIVVATTDPLDRRQILRGELFHARSPPDGRPRPLPGKRRRHVHSLALPLRHLSSLMGIEHRRETGRRCHHKHCVGSFTALVREFTRNRLGTGSVLGYMDGSLVPHHGDWLLEWWSSGAYIVGVCRLSVPGNLAALVAYHVVHLHHARRPC
ncbi:hypothetical protein GW17_00054528, partial [Ensete ventricosum]